MVSIHEKIVALLEQRHLKKRDLARALGVSPQTATDICKGRSAITLPHLRNLVTFFELRADFWIDDQRLTPEPGDRVDPKGNRNEALARTGLSQVQDVERLVLRLRTFLAEQRSAFLARNQDLTPEERRVLGFPEIAPGSVGRVGGASGSP
jgi:transcriptional regulator with XRE-family HTH domain